MPHVHSLSAPARCLLLLLSLLFCPAGLLAQSPRVLQIEVHDTLQGERASIFARDIQSANAGHYDALLVNLSTPGGMPEAADQMVAAIRQSSVPVIVWAGRPRTRISGEGLRLLAEADVALLNSQTFLTPLWAQQPHGLSPQARLTGSQRLLAALNIAITMHHRSQAADDDLATGAHWISAGEAVGAGFVDGLAEKPLDALRMASGRPVPRLGRTLHLQGASIDVVTTKPQEKLLLTLMNPDLSILLLTLGFLLVYLEINTPGTVVPGAAGVLLILLAAYALLMLPLSVTGVLLCMAAALLLLLEAQFRAHGFLAGLGILSLVIGLGTLVAGPVPQLQVSWPVAAGAGLGFGGVTATLIVLGVEARRRKVKTGAEAMLGWLAVAQSPLAPEGRILVRGELWPARLSSHDSFVAAGERVKVLRADGMTLEVTAVPTAAAG